MLQRNRILLILLIPGLLSALYLAARRYAAEQRNRSVELTLDYTELLNLSASTGAPMPELLASFKRAGVTGVAVTEDLIGDLAATGQVFYGTSYARPEPRAWIYIRDFGVARHTVRALVTRLRPIAVPRFSVGPPYPIEAGDLSPAILNTIGIGLPPEAVKTVRASRLDVVARLWNYPAMSKKAVDASLADIKSSGITRLICAGDEVIGFRGLIPYAAERIKTGGLIYGSVEFARQKGDAKMSRKLGGEFIRVHSIPYAEMATMSPSTAIERFARAVKERNIRLCYIRLIESSGDDPAKMNAQFVYSIRRSIEQLGYRVGTARPFEDVKQPKVLLILIGLSIAAAGVLTLDSLVSLSPVAKYGLVVLGFIATAGLVLAGEAGKQLAALSAALIFPTLAAVDVIGPYFLHKSAARSSVVKATGLFIATSVVTLCGAITIAGMLGTRLYMVKVEQFVGIKAAHLLPLLFILVIMAAGLPMLDTPFARVWERIRENLRAVMAHPLFVWHALAIMVGMAVLLIALMRTGNDAGIGVSGVELKLRAILDKIMLVRPRTKEFLIGHPALLLGIGFLLARKRSWGLPLVALGMVGQVSMLNTFCHIHTPLTVTVLRTFNGLVVGLVLGWLAWALIRRRIAGEPSGEVNK